MSEPPDEPRWPASDYYRAVTEADDKLKAALSDLVARQDRGEISPADALEVRARLLLRHLATVREAADKYL